MTYLIIVFILLYGVVRFDINKVNVGRKNWAYISCSVIILMFSLRYRIGTDSVSYQYFFEKLLPSLGNLNFSSLTEDFVYEPGFVIFINTVVFRFLYKRSHYFFLSVLLYFILFSFPLTCESIRQSLAMSLFLIAIPYIEQRNYVKYVSILAVAFFFHYSSVILFLLPLLIWCKVNTLYSYIFLVLLFLAGGTLRSQFGGAIEIAGGYFAGFDRAGTTYGEGSRYMNDAININAAIMSLLIIFMYIIVSSRLKNNQRLMPYNYLLFCYLCWQMLSINLGIFYRFASYFSIFGILYLSEGLLLYHNSINRTKSKNVFVTALVALAVVVMVRHNFQIEVFPGARQIECYYPYNSVVEKAEMPRREAIYNQMP